MLEALVSASHIYEIESRRKAALEAEAKVRGISVTELVQHFVDEGIQRVQSSRKEEWIHAAREGLAFEAKRLEQQGASLARYRFVPAGRRAD
ncbi:MAG TPA: hypothetical protein VK090_02415 [Paracoccaceae bacterium]|nr:hypothetical protein [Paracoccaceae bacterium]